MLPVQPSKLETLDDLLARAEHYANYSMRNMGRIPPTLFLVGPVGSLFMTESPPHDGEKINFAANARFMCIASAATAVVMALDEVSFQYLITTTTPPPKDMLQGSRWMLDPVLDSRHKDKRLLKEDF